MGPYDILYTAVCNFNVLGWWFVVVDSLLIVAPIVGGVLYLVLVLLFNT